MLIGKLKQIWRYPVKSMGGEILNSTQLNPEGIPGDRCWAVIDAKAREIRSAKKWPALLSYQAKLKPGANVKVGDFEDALPSVEVTFPDGQVVQSRDIDAAQKLSDLLGEEAILSPLKPPSNLDHYQLAKARTAENLASELQLQPGESMSDLLSLATPEMLKVLEVVSSFATPPGTYFDALPLHILTTSSLDYLRDKADVDAVVERFRPNLLIEPIVNSRTMIENDWLGKQLRIGEVVIGVHSRTVRCAMPMREQLGTDIKKDPNIVRAIYEHAQRHLGVYATIDQAGKIEAGDEVHLLET